jgi:ribonuclease BN (tRNA processing enzyme)
VERLVARVPNAPALKAEHPLPPHVSGGCGRVAQTAGVKLLVLSHLVPPDDPAITEQMWIDAARVNFQGSVIVGKDLLEI